MTLGAAFTQALTTFSATRHLAQHVTDET
jgi:hypothetical protein